MTVRTLPELPSLPGLYGRALRTGRSRDHNTLPGMTLAVDDVTLVPADVAGYSRVCGFGIRDAIPVTYPHILGFPLQVAVMTEPAFGFSLPGLIHVRNRITASRPIGWDDTLELQAHAEGLRPHDKGVQFDLVTRARIDDELAWTSTSTYLAKGRTIPEQIGHAETPDATFGELSTDLAGEPSTFVAKWNVAADTGRRYAGVSGDINPIHLNPLAAKAFGFPRAIAHGMWTKAKAVAAFTPRLPNAVTVDVVFDRPVKLPSKVELRATGSARSKAENGSLEFAVMQPGKGAHLRGRIAPVGD